MGVMMDEEKFRFDLQGYLVILNVLSQSECRTLADLADDVWPRGEQDGPFRRVEAVSRWGTPFVDLMDHPVVLPYLIELIGERLRIDHDYSIFTRKGAAGTRLHGGPRLIESDHWYAYADGVMRNGLTVATWNLTPAGEGEGGFVCVPGSHKTHFLRNFPADVRDQKRRPGYVVQPAVNAGDVLIFTEALIHGTAEWMADHERRTLLYKYSPPRSTWRKLPYDLDDYPNATAQQRRLMAPPSVEAHCEVVQRYSHPCDLSSAATAKPPEKRFAFAPKTLSFCYALRCEGSAKSGFCRCIHTPDRHRLLVPAQNVRILGGD